ncbi:hypothetical protein JCM10212_001939 [Sporobolomyces blumeae]
MPIRDFAVEGVLFDSDGTLVDSTPAVLAVMASWCASQGVDPRAFSAASHGRRAQDLLREFQEVPKRGSEMTERELDDEVRRIERAVVETAERAQAQGTGDGVRALPGVLELLHRFDEVGFSNWAIVTSATSTHARAALRLAGIDKYPFLVTGETVTHGKPDPEPYLADLQALAQVSKSSIKLDPRTILVVEDAPSGFSSGRSAGTLVLGVCTGPVGESEVVEAANRTGGVEVVTDLTRLEVVGFDGVKLKLRIDCLDLSNDLGLHNNHCN